MTAPFPCMCHFVQMGCGCMTEQVGMQFFLNAGLISGFSEDILKGALRDTALSFG